MLPANATPTSQTLAQLAQRIAQSASPMMQEIILDGSVARGFADEFSDLEFEVFSEHVPPVSEIAVWLNQAGFTGPLLVRWDESETKLVNSRYENVRVELAWKSFAYEAHQLEDVFERLGGPLFVNEAYKWPDAVVLRSGSHITQWKALFNHYPEPVRTRYIQSVLDEWRQSLNDPIETLGRWKDARRGAWFYLLKTHWIDLLPMLRVIFAYNRAWEPVAKWWHMIVPRLEHTPINLIERVNDVLSNPDPVARVDQLSTLQLDILALIADEYDVGDLIKKFEAVRGYGLSMIARK